MRTGMHPADIVAAVKKRGATLTGISLQNGLAASALSVALLMPSRRAEEVLIKFLGVPGNVLFPDRYDETGVRKNRRRRTKREIARGDPLRPTEARHRRNKGL